MVTSYAYCLQKFGKEERQDGTCSRGQKMFKGEVVFLNQGRKMPKAKENWKM